MDADNITSVLEMEVKSLRERNRRLDERVRELSVINSVVLKVAQHVDLKEVLRFILSEVLAALSVEKGIIYTVCGDGRFKIQEGVNLSSAFLEHPKICKRNMEEWGARSIVCNTASRKSRAEGIRSWVSVPLAAMSDPAGLIIAASDREGHFQEGDIRFLDSIAGDLGMALKNAQLIEKARNLSIRDHITGLYNRNYFEQKLAELESAPRPIGIIAIDVDGLKVINDTLGHASGDELIRATAGILNRFFSGEGLVARIGGDEFAIVLVSQDEETIKKKCDILKRRVNEFNRTNPSLPMSLSIGYATTAGYDIPLNILLRLADNEMYKNKMQKTNFKRFSMLNFLHSILAEKERLSDLRDHRLLKMARIFGRELKLVPRQERDLELLAFVHDIGKVVVPGHILSKQGPLTEEERSLLEKHTEIGHQIAKTAAELDSVASDILHHHERWDGNGYPNRLKNNDIPYLSRIISIIDAYDAMTSDRPYRAAMTREDAVAEIVSNAGTQFDPELVKVFMEKVIDSV